MNPQFNSIPRRNFLKTAGGAMLGTSASLTLPSGKVWAIPKQPDPHANTPESLVKTLYDSFSPGQREVVCFDWNYQDPKRKLLRTRVANNWDVTEHYINSKFFSDDQRAMIREIFEGIYQPEWHAKIDKQLDDDSGGFGETNSIAIFGEPGRAKFEFVLTGRHMTTRCDGNSAIHVAFGGPIFYGHAADGFNEGPDHPGNVFWPQALSANLLYDALDGKQRTQARVDRGMPPESKVGFRGINGKFQGLPIAELSADQKQLVQETLQTLLEPYRQSDQDEVVACLRAQGGLDACHMAYYAQNDLGNDQVWDCWRLEGPSFVWHYRGAPHVHVWVHVANDARVRLNA